MADEQNPQPGGAMSLADEERALHKGRGRMVFGIAVFAAVAIGAAAWFVVTSSAGEDVRQTLGGVNRLNRDHYKAFWGCALQSPMERFSKAEDLITKVSKMATGREKRYAQYIRGKCMPNLQPYRANLDALPPPAADLQAEVQEVGQRIEQVRTSWNDFVAYLESEQIDPETTPERVQLVAKGWYDYAVSLRKFQDKGRELIGAD